MPGYLIKYHTFLLPHWRDYGNLENPDFLLFPVTVLWACLSATQMCCKAFNWLGTKVSVWCKKDLTVQFNRFQKKEQKSWEKAFITVKIMVGETWLNWLRILHLFKKICLMLGLSSDLKGPIWNHAVLPPGREHTTQINHTQMPFLVFQHLIKTGVRILWSTIFYSCSILSKHQNIYYVLVKWRSWLNKMSHNQFIFQCLFSWEPC